MLLEYCIKKFNNMKIITSHINSFFKSHLCREVFLNLHSEDCGLITDNYSFGKFVILWAVSEENCQEEKHFLLLL